VSGELTGGCSPRSSTQPCLEPPALGVLLSASRDPDAKLTFLVTSRRSPGADGMVVKIPATVVAGESVDREGRMLVEMRRLPLGRLGSTIPRYVESLDVKGRPVLVSTAVPGIPMTLGYHQWSHTMRPAAVRADFEAAFTWLQAFQTATTHGRPSADWPTQVLEAMSGRWDGHPALAGAVARLEMACERLSGCGTASSAVHGDFWFGNVLVEAGVVSGVVDWEHAMPCGSPLSDAARFVLSYSLYLDRHTRPGRRVLGHPRLRRSGFAPGILYALGGAGWFPELVRGTLARHLEGLGLSPGLWYDVALCGIGEVAASANADEFGAGHLELLATLPVHARRHRRSRR
jgi:hypothetical protein